MQRQLLIDFTDLFTESAKPVAAYLAGTSRLVRLQCVSHLLGYLSHIPPTKRDYKTDMEQFFGPHSRPFAEQVYYKARELARRTNAKINFLHPKAVLQLFVYCFEMPDEEETQTMPELEASLFKACLVLNAPYIEQQSRAMEAAKLLLPSQQLAALSLAGTFSDFELVNHRLPNVVMLQLLKSVRFFEFLEGDARFTSLLQAFLQHFACQDWQEYLRRFSGVTKTVIGANQPGRISVEVPAGPEFDVDCTFLRHFALPEGQPLDNADFTSLRATPLCEEVPGTFVLVYPLLVVEAMHKGLYFRFNQVNKSLPKPDQIKDWHSVYCDLFSEQHLLYRLLDVAFAGRGLALSGNAIKAGWQLKGQAEPDYYFRSGHRALLVESKDVMIPKDAKAGHDFDAYYAELGKKFYRDPHPKAVLQLVNNIARLLRKQLPFDTDYDPEQLAIYPVLVVHDRLYNQPGLNVLVNGWFQVELAELSRQGLPVQHVKPVVIIDVDTLLAFHEHFRDGLMVLEDVLDAYYAYLHPANRTVSSQAEVEQLMMQSIHPFALFLENYADSLGLAPVPKNMLYQLLPIINKGAPE